MQPPRWMFTLNMRAQAAARVGAALLGATNLGRESQMKGLVLKVVFTAVFANSGKRVGEVRRPAPECRLHCCCLFVWHPLAIVSAQRYGMIPRRGALKKMPGSLRGGASRSGIGERTMHPTDPSRHRAYILVLAVALLSQHAASQTQSTPEPSALSAAASKTKSGQDRVNLRQWQYLYE